MQGTTGSTIFHTCHTPGHCRSLQVTLSSLQGATQEVLAQTHMSASSHTSIPSHRPIKHQQVISINTDRDHTLQLLGGRGVDKSDKYTKQLMNVKCRTPGHWSASLYASWASHSTPQIFQVLSFSHVRALDSQVKGNSHIFTPHATSPFSKASISKQYRPKVNRPF